MSGPPDASLMSLYLPACPGSRSIAGTRMVVIGGGVAPASCSARVRSERTCSGRSAELPARSTSYAIYLGWLDLRRGPADIVPEVAPGPNGTATIDDAIGYCSTG